MARPDQWRSLLLLLGLPVCELFLLRACLHAALGPGVFSLGVHGSDVTVPLLVGLGVLLWIGQRDSPLPLAFRPSYSAWHAVALAALLGLVAICARWPSVPATALMIAASFLVPASAALCFVSARALRAAFLPHAERLLWLPAGVLCLVSYPFVLTRLWMPLSRLTAWCVYGALRLTGVSVSVQTTPQHFRLWNPDFSATMVMGCSGLEGIYFFLFSLCLVRFLKLVGGGALRLARLALAGIALMFALNVARIALFFRWALFLERHYAVARGREFYEWVFHNNIGWLMYLAGLLVFFRAVAERPRPAQDEQRDQRQTQPERAQALR